MRIAAACASVAVSAFVEVLRLVVRDRVCAKAAVENSSKQIRTVSLFIIDSLAPNMFCVQACGKSQA
jgi:hypothetical protein